MPKYTYECLSCEAVFECLHSMTEVAESCAKCDSTEIEKRVSDFTLKSPSEPSSSKPVGDEVKSYIENAKKEIKGEKQKLSSRIIE